MTTDPDPRTPPPTRNSVGATLDSVLTLIGAYLVAVNGGALARRLGHSSFIDALTIDLLRVIGLSLGVALVCAAVPALQRNLARVPRDESGRPLPVSESGDGERGE